MQGHFKIAKILKTKGGSATTQDYGGNTCLHLVLKSPEVQFDMVKFLLDAGSDVETVDNVQITQLCIIVVFSY